MDLASELRNFKLINLEELSHNGEPVPDIVRNSAFLYNKALKSLQSGSEDIAIIELKKAASMNPRFYEAMNLLGICYSYLGEYEKAAEMFDRVIKAESNSVLAMNYVQRFGLNNTVQQQKDKPLVKPLEQPKPGEPLKRLRTEKDTMPLSVLKKLTLSSAIKIGAGFATGFLLAAIIFLSLPGRAPQSVGSVQAEASTAVSNEKTEDDAKLAQLQSELDILQKDKDSALQQADYYKAVIKLYDINELVKDKKYENAADMLLLLKTISFKDEDREKFAGLYGTVMPLAAKASYDTGYRLYNSRKYQDAYKALEKVQIYYPEFKRMDATLYYMGRSCQSAQDSRNAVACFQKLINEYPQSNYAKSAKTRIRQLTLIP